MGTVMCERGRLCGVSQITRPKLAGFAETTGSYRNAQPVLHGQLPAGEVLQVCLLRVSVSSAPLEGPRVTRKSGKLQRLPVMGAGFRNMTSGAKTRPRRLSLMTTGASRLPTGGVPLARQVLMRPAVCAAMSPARVRPTPLPYHRSGGIAASPGANLRRERCCQVGAQARRGCCKRMRHQRTLPSSQSSLRCSE